MLDGKGSDNGTVIEKDPIMALVMAVRNLKALVNGAGQCSRTGTGQMRCSRQ